MIKIIGIIKSIILLLLLPFFLLAQEEETGNWVMYFGTNKVSDKFSIHTEVQYRNHTIAPNSIEQLLLRTGLNYHFTEKAFASAGYAYIPSYVYKSDQKAPEVIEHRIWQQFILTNKISRIKFEHRYRIEQRVIDQALKSRFRYRLMFFVPLNKPKFEKGCIFVGFYDEIFVNAEKVFFDRNRLYGALGYQLHDNASVQIGILHQQVNDFGKKYLQFAVIFNPDFRNKNN